MSRPRAEHSNAPEVSYDACMALFVAYYAPSGQPVIKTVSTCPGVEFYRLVQRAIRSCPNPEKAREALSHLHEDDFESTNVDRWYAILELVRLKAQPFWYTSWIDARGVPASDLEHVS